jgi:hypothetical protein
MKNRSLNRLLRDDTKYKNFLLEKLGINEDIEIIKDFNPYTAYSIAYSIGQNIIGIPDKTRRIMYFILEKDELKEIREGCNFIIQHEIGHFHGIEYKNRNVINYFNLLLYTNRDNYVLESFPESEATRYAISKSKDYIEALAGFSAIASFLDKIDIKDVINYYSSDFSNASINNEEKRSFLNSLSSFNLSAENYKKVLEKAEIYLSKLNENLKRGFLSRIDYKKPKYEK